MLSVCLSFFVLIFLLSALRFTVRKEKRRIFRFYCKSVHSLSLTCLLTRKKLSAKVGNASLSFAARIQKRGGEQTNNHIYICTHTHNNNNNKKKKAVELQVKATQNRSSVFYAALKIHKKRN